MMGPDRVSFTAELITDGFCMKGRLDLPTGHRRLLNLLNFGGEPVIVLHDVEATRLGPNSDKSFRWPTAQIRTESIILAVPHEDRLPAAEVEQPLEYVPKERHRVSFVLPAFAVVGDLHLAKEVDINAASPVRGSEFVPLTDAEATYVPHPSLVWRAPAIIVNMAKAEVCCPTAALSPEQLS